MDTPVMADQIGRHGSLMLMKRTEPNTVLTGFGIDTDELTFGSSINCDVRLYFDDVASLHCKIVFPEKKAFLVVMGAGGVLLDGERIRPTMTGGGMQPTTVAMQNNSEIVVHGKHFRFAYPPKEMRPMLYATPPRADRRALRLSMIESARVFSPRPSPIPAENLRVLKSPIKRNASPKKPTPLHQATSAEDEDEDIVLVDGNHPRVVEEDKDLVILEDVVRKVFPEGSPFSGTPMRKFGGASRTPQAPHQAPHLSTPTTNLRTPQPPAPPAPTPARRPRASLHRGVLLRNAHRAAMRQEMEEEERHEEEEVFGTVVAGESDESEGGEEWEEGEGDGEEWDGHGEEGDAMDVDMHHGEKDYDSDDSYDDEDEDGQQGHERKHAQDNDNEQDDAHDRTEDAPEEGEAPVQDKSTTKTLGWRKSLERLWPFRSLSPEKEKVKDEEQAANAAEEGQSNAVKEKHAAQPEHPDVDEQPAQQQADEDTEEEDEDEANEQPAPLATPIKRAPPSHAYYTPQAARPTFGLGSPSGSVNTTGVGRGIGRMSLGGGPPQRMPVKTPWKVEDIVVSIPPAPTHTPQAPTQTPMRGRPSLSEAERRAIRERRQSARNAPDDFMGRVPGMTPGRTKSTSPVKERRLLPGMVPEEAESSTVRDHSMTPRRPTAHDLGHPSVQGLGQPGILGQPSNTPLLPDTRGLLDRMMSTIEDMKERRRQSLAASPIKPTRPPPRMEESEDESEEEDGDKENVGQKEMIQQEPQDKGKDKEATMINEDNPASNDDKMRTSEDDGSEEEWERLPAPPIRGRPASPVKPLSGRPASPVKPPSTTTTTTSQASTSHAALPQTPNMKGIREMFIQQKQRGLGTPAVEAVGEMFAPLETPVAGPPDTPSTGNTVTPSTGELEADDEATPADVARGEDEVLEEAPVGKPKSGRVMKGKGKKVATEESQPPATAKKTTRAKAAETPATRTRATRASSKQPEPSDVEDEAPPLKTTARGRRAKHVEEDESTGEEVPATRTRQGKAPASATKSTKAAAPSTIEEEPSSEEPAPRTRTRTRTRTTPTPEPEAQPKTTRTTRKTRTAPTPEPIEEEPEEEAPKRTTRTRKAPAVKREDSDEIAPLAGPSSEAQTTGKQLRKPTSRAKITPTAKAGASAAKAKAGTSAAKEKAAPRAESPLEKENTEEQAATKVRVTRRGGRKKVKEEEEDGVVTEPEPVVTRTRVTRSRAART